MAYDDELHRKNKKGRNDERKKKGQMGVKVGTTGR